MSERRRPTEDIDMPKEDIVAARVTAAPRVSDK